MKNFFYRVQKEDNIFSLSFRFNVPVTCIINENNLCREIEEGDILFITPKEKFYTVGLNEGYYEIAKKCNCYEEELRHLNRVSFLYFGLTIEII